MFYIHKHEIALEYGGPEEGGWWFEVGKSTGFILGPLLDEEMAYEQSRALNKLERERAKAHEKYEFTSVLAYMSNHYAYSVQEHDREFAYPETRPHYE